MKYLLMLLALSLLYSLQAQEYIPGHLYSKWYDDPAEIKALEKNDLSHHCLKIKCYRHKERKTSLRSNKAYPYLIQEEIVYSAKDLKKAQGSIINVYSQPESKFPINQPLKAPGCTASIINPEWIRNHDEFLGYERTDVDPYNNHFNGLNLCDQYYFDGTTYLPIDINGIKARKYQVGDKQAIQFTVNENQTLYVKNISNESALDFIGYDLGFFLPPSPTSNLMIWYLSESEDSKIEQLIRSNKDKKNNFKETIVSYMADRSNIERFALVRGENINAHIWLQPTKSGINFMELGHRPNYFERIVSQKLESTPCSPLIKLQGKAVTLEFIYWCELSRQKTRKAFVSWKEINTIFEKSNLPQLVGQRDFETNEVNGEMTLIGKKYNNEIDFLLDEKIQVYPLKFEEFFSKYLSGKLGADEKIPEQLISDCTKEVNHYEDFSEPPVAKKSYACDIAKFLEEEIKNRR